MFDFEKVHLTFSLPSIYFFIALLLLGAYAVYVYRYTVPQIPAPKKVGLVSLRILGLLLLLFVLFEPILTLSKKNILEPLNLVFVDNSRSMKIDDGTNRRQTADNFVKGLESNNLTGNTKLYAFGSSVSPVSFDSLKKLNYNEDGTDFAKIFALINKNEEENIASISIISDGVITEGTNPLYIAEKEGVPVFTVGVGDTSKRNDVSIKNVLYNQLIYAETPTSIIASILNKGFAGKNISVSLFSNNNLIENKKIKLSADGIQNVDFTYTPKTGGEKKLTVAVSKTEGEFTEANNKKVFYINVLSNKIKVLVLAGAPSSDLAFIKNSLEADENLSVKSMTVISQNKILEKDVNPNWVDSAGVFFLIGFPSAGTPENLLNRTVKRIYENGIPYFLSLSDGIDFSKLKVLQKELGFTAGQIMPGYLEVQPDISADQSKNPLLQNNSPSPLEAWNNLPPVLQPKTEFTPKPESEILARIKVNNVPINKPLIITSRLGSHKSITVLAKNIWRWKLQTATKNSDLFDRFIRSSVKWLNTKEDKKQVDINTSKKVYAAGEQVEFDAQVYDAAFNPVSDAQVKIQVSSNNEKYNVILSSLGNGLYEGSITLKKAGDYSFSGSAVRDGKKIGEDKGRFNIGEVDIEMVNPGMNYEFLRLLAGRTGGKFYNASNYKQLFSRLEQITKSSAKEKISVSEISLWSNEWLMALVILIFALEWFIRKRSGML